jgi:CRP-like cAMP-binding protein
MLLESPLRPLVRKLATHATLSDADRQAIISLPFKSRTIEPGGYIVREGDAPKASCLLISGFAYRQKHTGDGSRQIVALLIRGDLIDLQNLYLDESDHNVQALTRSEVAFIARADLQALAEHRPAVGRALFVAALVEASILREWVLNLGRRNAPARLAHVLCELAVRLEAQGLTDRFGYHFPMTQEQLADVTGLTPVHVNRTLKGLESQGLIKRDRRRFSIPDWRALRDAGDFNERYLHEQIQESASRLTPELI